MQIQLQLHVKRIHLTEKLLQTFCINIHCVKSFQKRRFFWSVFSPIRTEYGDLLRKEKTPYFDTFDAMIIYHIRYFVRV